MRGENKREYPFESNHIGGRDAWCRAADGYYHDFRAAGKTHARAVELAIREADADEKEGLLVSNTGTYN